ncbi:hypothetical protein [Azospirillum doebereinerae]
MGRLAGMLGLLLLAGCAGGVSQRDAASFNTTLAQGDYSSAARFALTSGEIAPDGKSKNLAWSLNAGSTLVYAGQPAQAVKVLDGAEELMKDQDLSNFGNTQYEYATYDGIMVNVYKGLAFLGAGDKASARVEFNRVGDRQSRAEEEFSKKKQKLDDEVKRKSDGSFNLSAAMQRVQENDYYRNFQSELGKFANYRPFINPAASYMRAIYLMNNADSDSDLETARAELVRVRDMVGPSQLIKDELALLNHNRKKAVPRTWVVFENGQAPTFAEYRVTFPVPVLQKKGGVGVGAVTIALPRMNFHPHAHSHLAVATDKAEVRTSPVGDFDRVMASEFQRRQDAIMARAVAEAMMKIGMQSVANQTDNQLLKIAAIVGSQISSADTRSWTSLPKLFEAARVDTPKDGRLTLRNDAGLPIGAVDVPADQSSIVYVKELAPGSAPSIQVFPL